MAEDEAAYWMELIIATEMLTPKRVQALLTEARELTRITGKSRVTAATHARTARRSSNGQ